MSWDIAKFIRATLDSKLDSCTKEKSSNFHYCNIHISKIYVKLYDFTRFQRPEVGGGREEKHF